MSGMIWDDPEMMCFCWKWLITSIYHMYNIYMYIYIYQFISYLSGLMTLSSNHVLLGPSQPMHSLLQMLWCAVLLLLYWLFNGRQSPSKVRQKKALQFGATGRVATCSNAYSTTSIVFTTEDGKELAWVELSKLFDSSDHRNLSN